MSIPPANRCAFDAEDVRLVWSVFDLQIAMHGYIGLEAMNHYEILISLFQSISKQPELDAIYLR